MECPTGTLTLHSSILLERCQIVSRIAIKHRNYNFKVQKTKVDIQVLPSTEYSGMYTAVRYFCNKDKKKMGKDKISDIYIYILQKHIKHGCKSHLKALK